ncbi:hypothetical protein COU95_00510 [Candidatus Shapirobacteria bacterium CG10_big_fil_rev_8_21_14_0_10_40_9]|uniref:PABS domain-containing protein n=1 Tax=Candidatus Shapirobacteria bacterium CG10_big_fil_rev_8_21_14_0_10_40_9 TaxID=1974888 RepID=A0A2M8L4E2_9BACT|nr:MAG: hypothetical protein COU95_00510 [Candidatus Shapirobacteria bacterium CG10_big_fil_rev_8_21_14_0_10_40_9]
MKKILQKFFRGYAVLEEVYSPINGKIQVLEDIFGKRRLVVGGLTQSGEAVEKVWRKTISNFQFPISNCLIMGLGAGSAAKVINKFFPEVKITGIEIDPEIIRLGKKYFGLAEIKNLEIKIADATLTINHKQSLLLRNQSLIINHHDLILVDLYLGNQVPASAETDKFLQTVKKILVPDGIVIFNRLYYSKKVTEVDNFEKKLRKIFPKIEAKKIETNKLFLCRTIKMK